MDIVILGSEEIARLRDASIVAAATLRHVGNLLRTRVPLSQIDTWVREDTARRGGRPSQLGYEGFPASVCVSRNQVVCHGIPTSREVLGHGDIVNLDVTTELNGFHGDCSATFMLPGVSKDARHVVSAARACRDAGISVVREGARLGDVGAAIEEEARKWDVRVVEDFGGHGIGREMHMAPHVSHTGTRGRGIRLRAGMAFTVEPMVNLGRAKVRVLDDGWTVVTADGSLSAQFEHTLVVTRDGCEVLTLPEP